MSPIDQAQTPRKKRGCWFYGCIALAVVVLIGGIITFFAARYGWQQVKQLKEQYTDTQPETIEVVSLPADQMTNLVTRVEAFKDALERQGASTELVLTADEINALIGADPDFKELAGKLFVMLEGDQVKGKVSYPLPDLGPLNLKGRYLNGVANLKVSLENGQLLVTLQDVEVKGKPLPAPIMEQLRQENIAKDAMKDSDTANAIRKFDSIRVEDGKLILKSKGRAAAP